MKYLLAILLLSGCAALNAPTPIRNDVRVIIKAPQGYKDENKLGTTTYLPTMNTCVITLRQYPECLLHEIRHCFEGQWHDARPNSEDC